MATWRLLQNVVQMVNSSVRLRDAPKRRFLADIHEVLSAETDTGTFLTQPQGTKMLIVIFFWKYCNDLHISTPSNDTRITHYIKI